MDLPKKPCLLNENAMLSISDTNTNPVKFSSNVKTADPWIIKTNATAKPEIP